MSRVGGVPIESSRIRPSDLTPVPARGVLRRRELTSNFLITVNTNYVPKNAADGQEVSDRLAEIGNDLFLVSENIETIFAFRPPYEHDTFRGNVRETMLETGRTEIGPKNGMVHLHVHLRVVHNSKVHLNRYLISQFFMAGFNGDPRIKKIWVNVKGFGDPRDARDYVEKTAPPGERRPAPRLMAHS